MVYASNDITLTLPVISSADNGLAITVKNTGSHKDLIIVQGNGAATIDNISFVYLMRWKSQTFIAYEGNWYVKERTPTACNILDVSTYGSWTTIEEVIEFLDEHMCMPVVVRLVQGNIPISNTITIDLPYPLTIQGASFGTTTVTAASGLAGKPMFRCLSESYFKMLMFDATTLSGYGSNAGEDCIRLSGTGTYHEIKDCTFDGFYNTILDSTDAELWLFECDISNAHNNGVLLHSNISGVKLRMSETDFISCVKGVNLEKGSDAIIQINTGAFLNAGGSDIGINYVPADFTSFQNIIISNNSWNNTGYFISGFDFTRADGRDADAFICNNAGMEDKKPHCKINVNNNLWTTTLASNALWYHANWINGATSTTCKWKLEDNKITYLQTNVTDAFAVITGNISVNSSNRVITIAICKNGSTLVRYGETDLRITVANQPFQFSTVIHVPELHKNDYLEVAVKTANSGDVVTF